MIDIKPFKGTRPFNEEAKNLIAPSTDHLNEQHLIDMIDRQKSNNPEALRLKLKEIMEKRL